MPRTSKPKRGSRGFSPRVRAAKHVPRMPSWPQRTGGAPRLQGFAGYKAGMTHIIAIDPRPKSTTAGQEIQVPVTVIEAPPMRIAAARYYRQTPYGLQTFGERWSKKLDPELLGRFAPAGGKGDYK